MPNSPVLDPTHHLSGIAYFKLIDSKVLLEEIYVLQYIILLPKIYVVLLQKTFQAAVSCFFV